MEPTSEYWMIRSHDGLLLEARFLPAEKETNKTVLAVHGYLYDGEIQRIPYIEWYKNKSHLKYADELRNNIEIERDYTP